jgi:hypothetical protein
MLGRVKARIRKEFVLRNKFTAKSIRVEKTRTLRVNAQESVVGSIASYMEDQEFGGTKIKKGKKGVPLPTTVASGEGRGVRPRGRLPRGPNKLAKIRLSSKGKGFKSKRQEIFLKVLFAARSGHKFVFLDTGRKQALYRVKGRGRVDKAGRITGIKMDMIYDLSHSSIRIPRTQIFLPTTIATQKQMPLLYRDALIFQLKRRGLFKG